MVVSEWRADLLVPPVSHHAEGPLWDERHDVLMRVDQYVA